MHTKGTAKLKKIVSIVTIAAFIFTNTVYGAPSSRSLFKNKKVDYRKLSTQREEQLDKKKTILQGEDAAEVEDRKKETRRVLQAHLEDLSQVHIPSELGRITEVYQAPSNDTPLVVHIQDLHTNPEGQFNEASILEILIKDYNLNLVLSEGAEGEVDTSSVSSFPDYEVREKTARLFVNSGELTAEEYLSITKYPNLPIWGIEDKDIYFKNIIDFNKIMKFNPQSQVFIEQVKNALEELKPKIYTKELKEIDQRETDYENEKIETDVYLKDLTDYIKKFNIPTEKYKNISILSEAQEQEKGINQQDIMQESQNLLLGLESALTGKSSRAEMDSLMAKAQLFKEQKISPFSFYSYLKDLALKHIPDQVSNYPNLNDFIDYLTKVNSLDTVKLFNEMEDLTFEIKQRIAQTDEQRTFIKAFRHIKFLEGFFNLKVSNEELDYYLEHKDSHKVSLFESFLKPTLKKYNVSVFVDFNPNLIDFRLDELEDFYRTVKQRDAAMFRNATGEIEKRNAKVAALVSGGFHTKGITKLLREKGYSYIVVSPYSSTEIDEENYRYLLSGKRKPITELIEEMEDLPEVVDRLSGGLRVTLASNVSLRKALKKEVIPELEKIWGTRETTKRPDTLDLIDVILALSTKIKDITIGPEVRVAKSSKPDTIVLEVICNINDQQETEYIEISKGKGKAEAVFADASSFNKDAITLSAGPALAKDEDDILDIALDRTLASGTSLSPGTGIGKGTFTWNDHTKTNDAIESAFREGRALVVYGKGRIPSPETDRFKNIIEEAISYYRTTRDANAIGEIETTTYILIKPKDKAALHTPSCFIWYDSLDKYNIAHAGRGPGKTEQQAYIPYNLLVSLMDQGAPMLLIAKILRHEARHAREKAITGQTREMEQELRDLIKELEPYLIPDIIAALGSEEEVIGPIYARNLHRQNLRGKLRPVQENDIPALKNLTERDKEMYIKRAVDAIVNGEVATDILTGGRASRMPMDRFPDSLRESLLNGELFLDIDVDDVLHRLELTNVQKRQLSEEDKATGYLTTSSKLGKSISELPVIIQDAIRKRDPNLGITIRANAKALVPVVKVGKRWYNFLELHMLNQVRLMKVLGISKETMPAIIALSDDNKEAQFDHLNKEGLNDKLLLLPYTGFPGKRVVPTVEDVIHAGPIFESYFTDPTSGVLDKRSLEVCYKRSMDLAEAEAGEVMQVRGLYDGKRHTIPATRGHGGGLHHLFTRGIILELIKKTPERPDGVKYISFRNIDNFSARLDENWMVILGYAIEQGMDVLLELSLRSAKDRGGTPIWQELKGRENILIAEEGSLDDTSVDVRDASYLHDAVNIFSVDGLLKIYDTSREELERIANIQDEEKRFEMLKRIAERGAGRFPIHSTARIVKDINGDPVLGVGFETYIAGPTCIQGLDINTGAVEVYSLQDIRSWLEVNFKMRSLIDDKKCKNFINTIAQQDKVSFEEYLKLLNFVRFTPTKGWEGYTGLNEAVVGFMMPKIVEGHIVSNKYLAKIKKDKTLSSNIAVQRDRLRDSILDLLNNSEDRYDSLINRARATRYIFEDAIDLIPGLPEYKDLPDIGDTRFKGREQFTNPERTKELMLQHEDIRSVIFGIRKAALFDSSLTDEELGDLTYALVLMKAMLGLNVRMMRFADGRICIYNENELRSFIIRGKETRTERNIRSSATRRGLEEMIRMDVVSGRGIFYDLVQEEIKKSPGKDNEFQALDLARDAIVDKDIGLWPLKTRVKEFYSTSYNRPDGLHRLLLSQCNGLDLWYGKENRGKFTFHIFESSLDKLTEDGRNLNEEAIKVLQEIEDMGFNVRRYRRPVGEKAADFCAQYLEEKYANDIKDGNLNPFIAKWFLKEEAVDLDLKDMMWGIIRGGNIGSARTFIHGLLQGRVLGEFDDDALSLALFFNREQFDSLPQDRQGANIETRAQAEHRAMQELYGELNSLDSSISIRNEREYEEFLNKLGNGNLANRITDKANDILYRYFAYSEDGSTGIVPQAMGQIVTDDIEHRGRFDRKLHEGMPRYLVVSEDTATETYMQLPWVHEKNKYLWVPANIWGTAGETIGKEVGDPEVGYVFTRDIRAAAGTIDTKLDNLGKKVIYVSGHFAVARDLQAESILDEFLIYSDKFGVDFSNLQQAVRPAVFTELNGSVSTDMHPGNQACCNTYAVDLTGFPLPTPGGWLRIEEPFLHTLLMFTMNSYMAWLRTIGGHERIPNSERPDLTRQILWENMAMSAYDTIFGEILPGLVAKYRGVTDPKEKIRALGDAYLQIVEVFRLGEKQINDLTDLRDRMATKSTVLLDKVNSARDEEQEYLVTTAKGLAEQFYLYRYELKVDEKGNKANWTRYKPVRTGVEWQKGRIRENIEWPEGEVETGEGLDISSVDWNDPVIAMPDGEVIKLPKREAPRSGETILANVAPKGEIQDAFLDRVRDIVVKQAFELDGLLFMFWPDIVEALKVYGEQVLTPTEEMWRVPRDTTLASNILVKDGKIRVAMVSAAKAGISGPSVEDPKKRLQNGSLPVMPVKEFSFIPVGYETCLDSFRALQAVHDKFQQITSDVDWSEVSSPGQVLEWMTKAINETSEGAGVFISIDMDASNLQAENGTYYLGEGKDEAGQFKTEQESGFIRYQLLLEYYGLLANNFSRLIGIDNAFAKNHKEAWESAKSAAVLEEINLERDGRFVGIPVTDIGNWIEQIAGGGAFKSKEFNGRQFLHNAKTGSETRVRRVTIAKLIEDKVRITAGKEQAAAYPEGAWRTYLTYKPVHTGMGTSGFRGKVPEMRDAEPYAIARAFISWLIKTGQLKGRLNKKEEVVEVVPDQEVVLAGDFRDSSPDFMIAVMKAYSELGIKTRFIGNVAVPNMAYYCQVHKLSGIMVTGSHTEGLYNGLKLYDIDGEVLNEADIVDGDTISDREALMARADWERERLYNMSQEEVLFDENGYFKKELNLKPDGATWRKMSNPEKIAFIENTCREAGGSAKYEEARNMYLERYKKMFGNTQPFKGHVIVYWEHSTVVRGEHVAVLESLGAEVIRVGRRDDVFISLDTENMTLDHLEYLKEKVDSVKDICKAHNALTILNDGRVQLRVTQDVYNALKEAKFGLSESIIGKTLILLGESSSDGDGDRSVVVDEKGKFWRGDVTGAIVAELLKSDFFVQSLTGNQDVRDYLGSRGVKMVDSSVGSPYHVYLIRGLMRKFSESKVMGQEVNGGMFVGRNFKMPIKLSKSDLFPEGLEFTLDIDELNTRDATTPMLLVFLQSIIQSKPVSELFEDRLDHYADNAGLIHEMSNNIPGKKRTGILMHKRYTPEGRFGYDERGNKRPGAYYKKMRSIKMVTFNDDNSEMVITYRGAAGEQETVKYDSTMGTQLLTLRDELQGFFNKERGFGTITQMAYGNLIDDGFVMWDTNGDRFHVRRSGNAPETRNYVYANKTGRKPGEAEQRARDIVHMATEPGGILRELEESVWNVENVLNWLETPATTLASNVGIGEKLSGFRDEQIISLAATTVSKFDPVEMGQLYDVLLNPKGRLVVIAVDSANRGLVDEIMTKFDIAGLSIRAFVENELEIVLLPLGESLGPFEELFEKVGHNIEACTLGNVPDAATRKSMRAVLEKG